MGGTPVSDPADRGPTGAGPLPDPDGRDDLSPTARALRDALAARAATAEPADRLEEIRMSTRSRRRQFRTRAALAVAAAVVVAAGAAAAVTRGGDDVTTVAATPTSTASDPAPASTAPSPPASASASSSSSSPAAAPTATPAATSAPTGTATGSALPTGTGSVPVYWLGGDAPKLFREFVAAPAGGNDPTRALRAMLAGDPTDPDYRSPWSADPSATVTATDGRLVVDLAASAATGDAAGAGATALQQLVHTVTAAAGDDLPVQVRVDGAPASTLFGTSVAASLSRAPQVDVQAPAWITAVTPAAGGVTLAGVGTAFEGTLLYVVTDAAGAEVTRGPVQAGANGTYREFSTVVELPAGTYTVAVFAPDESDGEGATPLADTKGFTVS